MLKTTPLLKSFTHNQINNLVEICETRDFCHSEIIIDEGEDLSLLSKEEKTIFYLI